MKIIKSHKWHPDLVAVLDRANTDGVTKPSYDVLVGLNGLIRRHDTSGFWQQRDGYYNFRHNGAEAFSYYNLRRPTGTILSKVGTTTFVANSYVQFAGPSGYYRHNVLLDQYGFYIKTSNAHHWGVPAGSSAMVFGVNSPDIGYILVNGTGTDLRLQTSDVSGVAPDSGTWTEGYFKMGRVNTSNITLNKNGVNDGNKGQANSWINPAAHGLFFGTRNNNGTATDGVAARMKYYAFGALTLDVTDLAVYNAELAFDNFLSGL